MLYSRNIVLLVVVAALFVVDLVLEHIEGSEDPVAGRYPWYLLAEVSGQIAALLTMTLIFLAIGSYSFRWQ